MAKVKMQFKKNAVNKIYEEFAVKLKGVDQDLRAAHTGESVEVIIPLVREAFARIGFQLRDADIESYSRSVSENKDFHFKLR